MKEKSLLCVGGTVQEELLGLDGSLIAKLATDPIQERSPSFSFNSPAWYSFLFPWVISHYSFDSGSLHLLYHL